MGGEAFFADLVSQFYARVATNPILRPMYPDEDMKGASPAMVLRTILGRTNYLRR